MLNAMYYKETLLIAIILISTILADDYQHQQSNEEVTPTSLDFFDAENTDDIFDPLNQPSFLNIFSGGYGMPQASSSSSSSSLASNDILTTTVPTLDHAQSSLSIQQHDEDDILNLTTTTASISDNEVSQEYYLRTNTSDLEYVEDQDESIPTTIPSIIPRTKQGKQIPISNLKPHESLRKFVEDSYIRTPLAILIDTAQNDLDQIKRLWRDALRPNAPLDCVLLAYNASGVSATYNFTNTRMLLAGINSITESDNNSSGNGFFGIIGAIKLIPYDSAIFVSTGLLPADANLAQYAATALLKKRIRLYLNWFGDKPITENETHEEAGEVLGNVAVRSGGEVILAGDNKNVDYPNEDFMIGLLSDHFQGPQDIELTIGTTMSDLHIKTDAPMKTAILETPYGGETRNYLKNEIFSIINSYRPSTEINLKELNMRKLRNNAIQAKNVNNTIADSRQPMTSQSQKQNSKSNGQQKIVRADLHLNIKLNHPAKYYLRLRPENSKDKYRITVMARNFYGANDDVEIGDLLSRKSFKSRNLSGSKLDSKREFTSRNGKDLFSPTHENIRFPDDVRNDDMPIEVDQSMEINVTKNRQQQSSTSLQNIGTVVEMGIQSQLLLTPGSTGQLYFEITNHRSQAISHNFQVTGEQNFLISLNLERILLASEQTVTAIVTVRIPQTAQIGTRDQITFTCQGYGQSSKTAILKVVQLSENQDSTQPSLNWNFGSRCDGNKQETGICADSFWSVDVTAHDWGTGLLRIQSNPRGIYVRNSYTAGTTSPVTATYSTNCCQPRVTISAHDLSGNARTAIIDVRDIYLSEASIAAIVLGALLLIFIIICIVIAIVWCCKRKQESREFQTYRSHSRTST